MVLSATGGSLATRSLTAPCTSSRTVVKLHNFSVPHFPHLQKAKHNKAHSIGNVLRSKQDTSEVLWTVSSTEDALQHFM